MATYPSDAAGSFTTSNFSTMSDRKPDKGYSESRMFSANRYTTESGYERRRLVSRRGKRSYNLTYSNINGLVKEAIENFYVARNGEFESFIFDLSHVNRTGTMTVRFDGSLDIEQVASNGSNALLNYYTVSFKLMETYD